MVVIVPSSHRAALGLTRSGSPARRPLPITPPSFETPPVAYGAAHRRIVVSHFRRGRPPKSALVTDQLPNADAAYIPEEKLRSYLLNPEHSNGTHKYRVFHSAFGVEPDQWESFGDAILAALPTGSLTGVRKSVGCTLYTVEITMKGQDGHEKRVITSWKVPDEGGAPSLVTAYLDI